MCLLCLCASCNKKDKSVAEYNHHKLYLSEVRAMLPNGLSVDDSLQLCQHIIDDWLTDQIILEEAQKSLSLKDKNFDRQMAEYRTSLLRQKYFEKITSDPKQFDVSDAEVRSAIAQSQGKLLADKEIVRLNYVKVSQKSASYAELKSILFDESRRCVEKASIESLCGDSLEYFIEDEQWLYWNDVQQEIPISLDNSKSYEFPLYFEKKSEDASYLVVILDYRSGQTGDETGEYFESMRTMLIQQKKNDFINKKIKELTSKHKKI